MRENCGFILPINILTPFARFPFSWQTNVCLDQFYPKRMDKQKAYSLYKVVLQKRKTEKKHTRSHTVQEKNITKTLTSYKQEQFSLYLLLCYADCNKWPLECVCMEVKANLIVKIIFPNTCTEPRAYLLGNIIITLLVPKTWCSDHLILVILLGPTANCKRRN